MLAVAGTALWWGGTVFTFFVALVAFLVVLEWRNIVVRFPDSEFAKGVWMAHWRRLCRVRLRCGAAASRFQGYSFQFWRR